MLVRSIVVLLRIPSIIRSITFTHQASRTVSIDSSVAANNDLLSMAPQLHLFVFTPLANPLHSFFSLLVEIMRSFALLFGSVFTFHNFLVHLFIKHFVC